MTYMFILNCAIKLVEEIILYNMVSRPCLSLSLTLGIVLGASFIVSRVRQLYRINYTPAHTVTLEFFVATIKDTPCIRICVV